jgi:hypothetical protein
MADKGNRVQMAQIVAFANFPDLKRFPDERHIVVRKELRRNFGNLKDQYDLALAKLAAEQRTIPISLPVA